MYCKVNKCCFCFSLRCGIILLAYFNMLFTLLVMACMVMTTELQQPHIVPDPSLEMITATVLFAILGMAVILNILLLVAGYQKDARMLRLYNYYAVATTVAMVILTIILLSRRSFAEVSTAFFAIVMQIYVVLLVRSEIQKLELIKKKPFVDMATAEEVVISDQATLL